jgi:plant cysteine oxidase
MIHTNSSTDMTTSTTVTCNSSSHTSNGTHHGLESVYDIIRQIPGGDVTTMLERLREAVHTVSLEELGLVDRALHRRTKKATIEYMHLYEDKNVSMGIFCLPKNSRIPLHNHPGMSVVSRVLYGDLHVTSFDWTDTNDMIAKPVYNGMMNDMMGAHVLLPNSHGNMHQFTAHSDCAILDILCPPYSPQDGRDCTYYRVESMRPDGCVELREYNPKDFRITTVQYTGRPSSAFLM